MSGRLVYTFITDNVNNCYIFVPFAVIPQNTL